MSDYYIHQEAYKAELARQLLVALYSKPDVKEEDYTHNATVAIRMADTFYELARAKWPDKPQPEASAKNITAWGNLDKCVEFGSDLVVPSAVGGTTNQQEEVF